MPHPIPADLEPRSRSAAVPCQPKNFLRPCLLLLLDEQPGYGYDLRERLGHLGGAHCDVGTIYRALNALEDEGLAHSTWEPSQNGPQRRRYQITIGGQEVLARWSRDLDEVRHLLLGFLERYEHDREAHPELFLRDVPPSPVTGGSEVGVACGAARLSPR